MFMKCLIIAVVVFFLGLVGSGVHAQLNTDKGTFFTTSVGYVSVKNAGTGNSSDGYNVVGSLERLVMQDNALVGFNFGFIRSDDEFMTLKDTVKYVMTTYPVMLSIRFLTGTEKFKVYLGIGAGIHVSTLDQSNEVSEKITEPALNLPVGFNWFFNDAIYLNLNYGFNFFSDSFYQNNIVHQVNLGVGIQFGN